MRKRILQNAVRSVQVLPNFVVVAMDKRHPGLPKSVDERVGVVIAGRSELLKVRG